MLPGETILSGAPRRCPDCGEVFEFQVCSSAAGYYIGTWCDCCGPYSRETGYTGSRAEAERWLEAINKGEHCEEVRR